MTSRPTEELRAEAVRVALTSGLPLRQAAADFGIGFSTVSRWIQQDRRNPEKPAVWSDRERVIAELRKEKRMRWEERGAPKKSDPVLCGAKQMRFAFVHCPASDLLDKSAERAKNVDMPLVERLCQMMEVSPRGYRAFRNRPLSQSQRKDRLQPSHGSRQPTLPSRNQKLLRQHGFKVSMSRTGNCYDNAAVETFFKTMKA